mgnify:CR=1 FL=1
MKTSSCRLAPETHCRVCGGLVDFLFHDLAIGLEGKHLPDAPRRAVKQLDYAHADHITGLSHQVRKAGQFVEHWDDENARKGYCLYKMGCKGPTTYNACSTIRWNEGVSFPIQAGHGCIGCSEDGFWDKGSWYARLQDVHQFGIEANADKIGGTAAAVAYAVGTLLSGFAAPPG